MDWNADAIARLKSLWTEGLSTAEIGRRLNISKNAVVGKAHRLALVARPSPIRRDPNAPPRPRQSIIRRMHGATLPPLSSEATDLAKAAAAPQPKRELAPNPVAEPGEARGACSPAAKVLDDATSAADAPMAAPGAVPETASYHLRRSESLLEGLTPASKGLGQQSVPDESAAPEPKSQEPAAGGRPPPSPLSMVARSSGVASRPSQRNAACCWPIGEPGTPSFHFCGKTSAVGRPYCEAHAEIAYVRVRDRRDNAA